jgi:hypothetical protein
MPDVLLLKWCPHQELHLEPRPLEAAYALSVTPCGHEAGSSGWVRTNASALTERHPTIRSPRILKWWTRTVTLRLLLGANQPCSLLHYDPLEIGGRDGCCPRCLLPDKEASLLLLFTTMEMDAGAGVAPTRHAYEAYRGAGPPCWLK